MPAKKVFDIKSIMKKNVFTITILFLIFSLFYFGKCGNMLIDFSREAYIPYQINNGEKLIKDIFLIYGSFGYIFNSILYKLFGLNINILLILSHIISYIAIIIFYFISKNFLKENESLILTALFISASIFSNSTFSFVLPYSYSTLWAYLASYATFLFYLKKQPKIMFLLLGFILINKIELFILMAIFLIALEIKENKLKNIKDFSYILILPTINLIYFVHKGITINDTILNLYYIKEMISTNAIYSLYKSVGVYIQKEYLIQSLISFILILTILIISEFIYKKNFKYTSISIIILSLLFFNLNNLFNLCIILITYLSIFLFIKKRLSYKDITLIIFAIILNLKSIFKINPLCYTNFGYIFAILTLYVLLKKVTNKKWLLSFFLIFTTLITITNFKYNIKHKKYKTKLYPNIQLTKNDSILFDKTNEYILKNIKNNENFIVVPEGQIFNLIHKKPWNFYNSTFTPLDFETFKEEQIIEQLKKNKTEYIIFYPRNTKEYGAQTICYNYGVNFCTYIMDYYKRTAIIENEHKVLIFKINEK